MKEGRGKAALYSLLSNAAIVGEIPPAPPSGSADEEEKKGLLDKPWVPPAGGALASAVIGYLLGGPAGALIGAGVGVLAGWGVGKLL